MVRLCKNDVGTAYTSKQPPRGPVKDTVGVAHVQMGLYSPTGVVSVVYCHSMPVETSTRMMYMLKGLSLMRAGCGFTPCEPCMRGVGLGGLEPTPSLPILVIGATPFTDDHYADFRRLGPSMSFSRPFSAPKTFVGHFSTLSSSATCAVDAGALPVLAFRPPFVSLPPTIGATAPSPTDLISSRTRHRTAAAAGSPHPTADYGFGRRVTVAVPRLPAPSRPRAPAPSEKGPPRPSEPATS